MTTPRPVGRGPSPGPPSPARTDLVRRILGLAREQAGMPVAVLSEFSDACQIFRLLEGDGASFELRVGASIQFQDSPCRHALEHEPRGRIGDARNDDRVKDLVFTRVAGVGAYVGAPVRLPDGRVYGTLFCLDHAPRPDVDDRDVAFLETLGQLIGDELDRQEHEETEHEARRDRIRRLLDEGHGFGVVFQPIFDLGTGRAVGVEALARFPGSKPPDRWFSEAAEVGLGLELEVAAVRAAISLATDLPEDMYLSVNVSPETLVDAAFHEAIGETPGRRLVVEVTEHARVDSYAVLNAGTAAIRGRGARLAIDDVGAGFASLQHVLRLRPDIIKLDLSLTHDIDTDPVRRALAASFISFARETYASIVAEGIESQGEVDALRALGVTCGQGFHLARPAPLEDLAPVVEMQRAG